jgi:hypothetical protein
VLVLALLLVLLLSERKQINCMCLKPASTLPLL